MKTQNFAHGLAVMLLFLSFTACSDPALEGELPISEGEAPLLVKFGEIEKSISYEELAELPSKTFTFDDGSYFDGREVSVVPLSEFWKFADPDGWADTMTAYCTDKYFSVYTREWTDTYDPFIIYKVDGKKPSEWTDGLKNAAPYFISFKFEDGMPPYQHASHKQPWGVHTVTFGKYEEMFSVFLEGPFADLEGPAVEGRDVWINSCSSCHEGPGNGIGGHKAARPWEVLAVHATMNVEYFKKYVHDPKSLNPAALMEPHPHITHDQLDALVAFLSTGG